MISGINFMLKTFLFKQSSNRRQDLPDRCCSFTNLRNHYPININNVKHPSIDAKLANKGEFR